MNQSYYISILSQDVHKVIHKQSAENKFIKTNNEKLKIHELEVLLSWNLWEWTYKALPSSLGSRLIPVPILLLWLVL